MSLSIQDLNKEVQYMSKAQTEIYESLDLFCNTVRQLLKGSLFADDLLRRTREKLMSFVLASLLKLCKLFPTGLI